MTIMKKLLTSAIASTMLVGGAQAAISDNMVKIGYLADMSGTYRDFAGPNGEVALKMAIEDFGGTVNGAKIEVISSDDRNSPDVASSTARRWVENDNVDLIAGLVASSVVIAVIDILEESGKLGIVSGSASSSITNEHCTPNHIHYVYDTYPLANGTASAIVKEGGKKWFILAADYAFGQSLEADVTKVVEANGGEIIGSIRHPFPTPDFSSFILQAQGSGADVVALANAGADTTNAITTASEFGLTQSGQTLAALVLFLTDVHALGVEAAQGIQLTTGWYWDMNADARAWSDRFMEKTGVRPTMIHAGIYSSTIQYLNAVKATGSDEAQTVRKQMMATPINDMFATNGRIREDGRMVHDMYLAQVKTPAESKNEWDLYKIIRTIPGGEAFRPLSESKCPLITSK
ncbi:MULTISPECIES: ABC transporter substrate-binding protein [unclassified Marinobacter]|jgi:branched-chain amino acid transport system substrate-binding protein|uniref:ABC transporter substrate-binding protein n=1 Tax=unclassified Marinobacter TaxID=83889 RepID=UPI0020107215|nr:MULTISPECIES: ABC transporter substrate-binding protein [unclassified Marinobacter]MCL1479429.1 ABC transporter substrate-binding protein [Marinobacter sp.]MCL1482104.1 ABC transporter substrate-binding protein [Marinobacter sp.]MCL1483133.1 ABC transporter substrate-binding protein [Marinobacter sp.]MCL1488585.1 ABC transporter substrate-binding protein [Marinobacter sp.]UQG54570.1 ABC transporter substrate-binding protein [Marinobacter sp. M4C]